MRAIEIIRAEHRNMWRAAHAMQFLGQRFVEGDSETDRHTVDLIVDYFESFSEIYHHPKEEGLLLARLEAKSKEAAETIARLRRDHDASPAQLRRIRQLAATPNAAKELSGEIVTFCGRLAEHMRMEEDIAFDLAARTLSKDEWGELDAAFSAHDDPLNHGEAGEDIALLRHRIAQILPAPEGLGGHVETRLPLKSPAPVKAATPLLEIDRLESRYGRIKALHGVSITVRQGELVALVGANGAGKTTLLRCISGVQPVTAGELRFAGESITCARPESRVRAGICQSPEGRQVFAPMSIEDNLIMGAHTRPGREIAQGLTEIFELFPILAERRKLPAGTLSGGQQQMLAIGRALMGKPKLLLLDEPSMGLAPLIVEDIFRIVRMLKEQRGMTILLVEQNARAALAISDYAYVLETGGVSLEGSGTDLLSNDMVQRAYLGM